jgi:hypothetical protein
MSGGHFDYLYSRPLGSADEYRAVLSELRRIVPENIGSAQLDLETLIARVDDATRLAEQLTNVLRAIEWCASGDRGPNHVVSALEAYDALVVG